MTEFQAKTNLLDMVPADARKLLSEFFSAAGEPAYRVNQVMGALWTQPAPHFVDITSLPVALRDKLSEKMQLPRLELSSSQQSSDGTQKFLFRLADGQEIETVAIPDGKRLTICISSQAGCALKCDFCATGAMGFVRNLSAFEIAAQIRELRLLPVPLSPTNVVFMGMGEPLMNWANVDRALTILNAEEGMAIGARHITVSTVGVLPGIEALAERKEQFRLAISIHAPSDELRRSMMPINIKYPLADVVAKAAEFSRRVTFEYVMLAGVNDSSEYAAQLAKLALRCGAFINLIPLHPGGTGNYLPTSASGISRFARMLTDRGVEVAVRKSRGKDIAAACGQLRAERIRRRTPVVAN